MTKPGRPKLPDSEKSDWIKLGTKVSPEAVKYLAEMKKRGYIKSRVVDAGILLHKTQCGGD